MNIFAEAAPAYWAAGLPVIPLRPRNKMPDIHAWSNYGREMPTELEQAHWVASFPTGNIGLPLGVASGLCIIDIDTEDEELIANIRACLPASPWVRVGKKGMALAYEFEGQKNFKLRGPDGGMILEFLGQGNQVVLPPSIHPDTGRPYVANSNLWEVAAKCPPLGEDIEDKLRALLGSKGVDEKQNPSQPLATGQVVLESGRHTYLTGELGRIRNLGYTGPALLSMARALNEQHCLPPLPNDEVEEIVRAATEDWAGGDGLPFTDAGNAQRLVRAMGGNVRWVREGEYWACWNATVWAPDVDGYVERLAKSIGPGLANAPRSSKAQVKWGNRSQSAGSIRAMIQLARSEPGLTVSAAVFDTRLNLLNTQSGPVDLSEGMVRPAEPTDYFTQSTSVAFDPTAECPRWLRFLSEVQPDPEVASYVQRLCGYIATGLTREHIAVFASGAGRNGKSLLFNTVAKALGDYGAHTRTETFMQRQTGAMSNDLAALNGPRLVLANESNRGQRLDTALMKGMTGGDPIQARFLRQEFVTFFPRFTPVIISNHMPEIDANDPAIWERLVIVPFTRTFEDHERDKDLSQTLQGELPGILRWIVEGAVRYHELGLSPPPAITNAVRAFRGEMDTIGAFLGECCVLSPNAECPATQLYLAFEQYAREIGVRVPTRSEFGMEIGRRGIGQRKSNVIIRTGVALRPANYAMGAAA